MEYLRGSFSVGSSGSKEYRDNYDRVFGTKDQASTQRGRKDYKEQSSRPKSKKQRR